MTRGIPVDNIDVVPNVGNGEERGVDPAPFRGSTCVTKGAGFIGSNFVPQVLAARPQGESAWRGPTMCAVRRDGCFAKPRVRGPGVRDAGPPPQPNHQSRITSHELQITSHGFEGFMKYPG